ncbi:hypothetical protein M409DRAFT_63430 [Zasmidium cellare ATCC 36951]|uniref:Tyrosine specific protein phosphatases domain-containing protein n=1 Tax=Zasmidium cellare ATCC 36951 TaxID=1080233 RepID=A0A6A6D0E3_ZASCE|nr:uncharacterized protein M409DRAFT_63430 [Zasmidium cellare ATCC 36951]KAF2171888.1 hypothetical protein M409DRAFT_63430 [Zasmidium cellare ATCC 36951]
MASSLPSPPFIPVEGISNFRDIGDTTHVRRGLVYRSADPSKATPAGLKKMSEGLGIKVIFDLRSTPEIQRDGPEWAGVEVDKEDPYVEYGITRKWVPVFAASDYGPEQVGLRYQHYTKTGSEGFVKAYNDILLAAPSAYTAILKHLAQPNPTPCLIHCTAGKDRTGVLVALLFLLAGVDTEAIADEYSLTDLGLEHLKPLFIERLLKNPALEGNEDGVRNMVSSKRENMVATVEMIEGEFGGAEGYLRKQCGLSGEVVEALRRNLKGEK